MPEGADTADMAIAFYGQQDCETLVAVGNVDTCLGLGHWSSYKVLTLEEADDQLTNLDGAELQSLSVNATVTASSGQGLSSETASATGTTTAATTMTTSAPMMRRERRERTERKTKREVEDREAREKDGKTKKKRGRISHGDTMEFNGRQYRYHQLSARTWRGVPIERWDAGLHKRNTQPLPHHRSRPLSHEQQHQQRSSFPSRDADIALLSPDSATSAPETSGLRKRAGIDATKCNLVRSCALKTPSSANFLIRDVGDDLMTSIATHSADGNDWTFLEHPFVVEIMNTEGGSEGYVYAQTENHSDVKDCATADGAMVKRQDSTTTTAVNGTQPQSQKSTTTTTVSGDGNHERQILTSALIEGVGGSEVSDLRVDLKINSLGTDGATNSLFVSTRSAGTGEKEGVIHVACIGVEVFF
ncbi:uncharacterized protein KY384_003500 [Bacidia gigantensis]|uniref:uncharacterized protein n=1 Tax=Bacidia gigantensis TaxID=2732470 RepID=UPI001D037B3E|nr:uncharacterized protein KY384_003500 [Bacidia gigantensis]KAG8531864.1 hypothetical protein KY384_003500 [Bacidia gigantensis]